jgi:hypothetical protein
MFAGTRSNGRTALQRGADLLTYSGIYNIDRNAMVNYIQLYKIKKKVKSMLREKLALGELATTPSSCLDCLATDLSWEMYYIMKEKEED